MNAQQLKNAILQEAIEGRLVPQDPNDEPASVLLARIRKEKERLVKEGKLKKKDLEVNPISEDEIPFEIPDSWEWVRLKDITELIEDCPHSTAKDEGKGYPLVRTPNVGFGKLLLEGVHRVSESVYNKRNERAVPQAYDLIYAREATAGNVAVIEDGQKVCLGQRTVLVRPMHNNIDSYWLAFFILSPYSYSSLVGKSTGTTVAHVNLSDFRPFVLPLPPLAEQHRIVAKIEELLPKVEEYGKAQDALNKLNAELPERLKKSILQEAIEGRLVPQDPNDEPASVLLAKIRQVKAQLVKAGKLKKKDLIETTITEDEIPFEIPESWEWCNLGYLITLLSGRDLAPSEYNDSNDGIPYMTGASNFESGSLLVNRWTTHPVTISHKGDLLITCKGTIGEMAFNTLGDIHIARQIMAINSHFLDLNYVRIFLMRTVSELEKKAKSIIPGISREDILDALFPLPPLSEQHRIVEKLEQLLGEIDKLKK